MFELRCLKDSGSGSVLDVYSAVYGGNRFCNNAVFHGILDLMDICHGLN